MTCWIGRTKEPLWTAMTKFLTSTYILNGYSARMRSLAFTQGDRNQLICYHD